MENTLSQMRKATNALLEKIGNMPMFAEANLLGQEAMVMAGNAMSSAHLNSAPSMQNQNVNSIDNNSKDSFISKMRDKFESDSGTRNKNKIN